MIRRPLTPKSATVEQPLPEYEDVPLTVVNIAFLGSAGDKPFGETFYLEASNTIEKTDSTITITQGEKVTEIDRTKVIYVQTFPTTAKRKKKETATVVAEAIAALSQPAQ